MHSLPSPSIMATRYVGLKRKLPSPLRRKRPTCMPLTTTHSALNQAPVDQDLLATVLRVHLEMKQRKARIRAAACTTSTHETTVASSAQQRAVNAVDEPHIQDLLSSQRAHYGFDVALAQLTAVCKLA